MHTPNRHLSALIAVAACLLSTATFAASGGSKPPSTRPQPSGPTFDCSITPASPPGPNEFQVTSATVTLKSGTLPANKKVAIRLGISPNGNVLTHVCTSSFGRTKTATAGSIIVAPPIMDPDYIWMCNARLTSTDCDPPSAPPR